MKKLHIDLTQPSLTDVPAISTNRGMPSQVIRNAENGIMVRENTIEEFVNEIIKLYDNRELLFKMSRKIREDAINSIGLKIQKDNWQKLFNQLL